MELSVLIILLTTSRGGRIMMLRSGPMKGSAMSMTGAKTPHEDLHSEQGALRGDRPARAKNPVIKVEDLAWLEFEKPDLDAAERFAHDFGFATAYRSETELHLRGTLPGSQSVIIRRGPRSRFVAPAFRASSRADLRRLARATGTRVQERRRPGRRRCRAADGPGGHPGAGGRRRGAAAPAAGARAAAAQLRRGAPDQHHP